MFQVTRNEIDQFICSNDSMTDDDGYSNDDEPEQYDQFNNKLNLKQNIHFCTDIFPAVSFLYNDPNEISFQIMNWFLPKSILHINNFDKNPVLCEINIKAQNTWYEEPHSIIINNPISGKNFIGHILIEKRIKSFFSPNYNFSLFYRCQNYIISPNVTPDDSKIAYLLEQGFNFHESAHALSLMENDLQKSINFLQTGINTNNLRQLAVKYKENPLFFLILEIAEAFFDISDHCCICGKPLDISSAKPSCCNDRRCKYIFFDLGMGGNIINEIKRDPIANDLIISLASTTYKTKYFNPRPTNISINDLSDFFNTLPSMRTLASNCTNDQQLREYLNNDTMFEILRFLILSNKSQITTLDTPELQIKEIMNETTQFLVNMTSPETEKEFQLKKMKYRSMYLWHGSDANRWYSILNNGLKDLGRTEDRVHEGPIHGDGIYLSNYSNCSVLYSYERNNEYKNSLLPKSLVVMALTENAKTHGLRHSTQYEYTQIEEEACIIRALMVVNDKFQWDVAKYPPKCIPSLSRKSVSNQRFMPNKNCVHNQKPSLFENDSKLSQRSLRSFGYKYPLETPSHSNCVPDQDKSQKTRHLMWKKLNPKSDTNPEQKQMEKPKYKSRLGRNKNDQSSLFMSENQSSIPKPNFQPEQTGKFKSRLSSYIKSISNPIFIPVENFVPNPEFVPNQCYSNCVSFPNSNNSYEESSSFLFERAP